jgi:dethiobiotin synthetase
VSAATPVATTFFITGTDTGVGKTRVTAGLLAAARDAGLKAAGMKPVAAGAEWRDGRMLNDDALMLAQASGQDTPYDELNPYCLIEPISPHIAANRADICIDIDKITEIARRMALAHELLLIEGAGGWYTPLGPDESMATLARALAAPVVLVVGMRLGCLNHARLTREAIERSGCRLAGWIASGLDPQFAAAAENLATLASLLGAAPLGLLPFEPDSARDALHLREALLRLRAAHEREIA